MSTPPIVKPRAIGGFPEWLPEEKLVEERCLEIIRTQFRRFGFTPIETPAVERREVLAAKGVVEKEIYALTRLAAAEGEDPSTELALHFDLTVPTARYVAQHFTRLTFPFRRSQIQKVWRGERPQAGRFREFYQCDIDIIGNGALSPLADAEIPVVIHAIFSEIGVGPFRIRINNRKILQGLLRDAGLTDDALVPALRLIDALEKIGGDAVARQLADTIGLQPSAATKLVEALAAPVTDPAALSNLGADPLLAEGAGELAQVVDGMRGLGLPDDAYVIDLTIARGLDYYTGTVYETQLVERPEVGSICSGGRYDNLASTFTKQKLPGVGISIGLTRLLSRLFEAKVLTPGAATPASVLVTTMDRSRLADYLAIAARLRTAGVDTEVFTEPKKMGDQLKYADKKGFRYAVIAGEDEFATGTITLKNLSEGTQATLPPADAAAMIKGAA